MDKLRNSTLILLLLTAGCNTDVSVPEDLDISGCYAWNDITIKLSNGIVEQDGLRITSFKSGRDKSGSYVVFKPAIHLLKQVKPNRLSITKNFPQNYVTTIMQRGDIVILMPAEPNDQAKFIRDSCKVSSPEPSDGR